MLNAQKKPIPEVPETLRQKSWRRVFAQYAGAKANGMYPFEKVNFLFKDSH